MPRQLESIQVREARLFRDNKRQAVLIPEDFEFATDRVTIQRDGDRLMIAPVCRRNLLDVLTDMEPLEPEDWMSEIDDTLLSAKDVDF